MTTGASRYDVTLGGQGYMVRAGSYTRKQDGYDQGVAGRARLFDFYGGQQRAASLERDRFWSGLGAWPTFDGQGVQAGPKRTDVVETAGTDPSKPSWSVAWGGATYVVNNQRLFRVTTGAGGSGGVYAGLVKLADLYAPVVGVALADDYLAFAHGQAARCSSYNLAVGAYKSTYANAPHWDTIADGGLAYGVDRATDRSLVMGWWPGADNIPTNVYAVDSEVLRQVNYRGEVWSFTRTGIWSYGYSSSSGAKVQGTAPRLGFPDDLAFLLTFQGELYAWIAHEVQRYDPTDDIFEPLGLRGLATYGATGVGTWLVVSLVGEISGLAELWAWDGTGWWQLDQATGTADQPVYPVSIAGAATNADLLVGRGTAANQTAVYQLLARANAPGLRDTFVVTSSLLDGGNRDIDKAWLRAGVELAWPDSRGTADWCGVQLEASVDGGRTWAVVTWGSLQGTGPGTATVAGAVAGAPRSRWLQLRATVSSVLDWSPVVVGLWAEYELLSPTSSRRRWTLAVECRDRLVTRDGTVDATGARATAAALWALWDDGAPVAFRDVDDDLAPVEYTVRVVAIAEEIPKPAEAGKWGDGVVSLTLVEV